MSAREECGRLEQERIDAEQFIDVVIVSEPSLEESGDLFFYETMEDVAFDRMFQRMARESGLTVRRLEIIRPESGKGDFRSEKAVPRAESPGSAGDSGSAGSSGGAGSSGSTGSSGSLGNASGPEFRYAQVHLELAGDGVRDAMRMADRIDAEPASMVVSYMGIEPDSHVKASASETAGVIDQMWNRLLGHMDKFFFLCLRRSHKKTPSGCLQPLHPHKYFFRRNRQLAHPHAHRVVHRVGDSRGRRVDRSSTISARRFRVVDSDGVQLILRLQPIVYKKTSELQLWGSLIYSSIFSKLADCSVPPGPP